MFFSSISKNLMSYKIIPNFAVVKWFLFLLFFGIQLQGNTQTNDLFISKYVDWSSGNGYAIEIYNPTNQEIDLSNYEIKIFYNGNNSAMESFSLSGKIASLGVYIFGNNSYCQTHCSNCDRSVSSLGINGNEVVALYKGQCAIDKIGQIGTNIPSNQGWRVANVNNATYRNVLSRSADHLIRYTSDDGVSVNSWPSNKNTNVTGWSVSTVGCLNKRFSHTGTFLPAKIFIGGDTATKTICASGAITLISTNLPDWYMQNLSVGSNPTLLSNSKDTLSIQNIEKGNYLIYTSFPCHNFSGDSFRLVVSESPVIYLDLGPENLCNLNSDSQFLVSDLPENNMTYLWKMNNKPTILGQITSSNTEAQVTLRITNQIEGTDTLFFTKTNEYGCRSDAYKVFNHQKLSFPTHWQPSYNICEGDTLVLTHTFANDITKIFNPNLAVQILANEIKFFPTTSRNYKLNIAKNNCKDSILIDITVNEDYNLIFKNIDTVCKGENVTLETDKDVIWPDGSMGTNYSFLANQSQWIAVRKINNTCGFPNDSIWVNVAPLPDASFDLDKDTILIDGTNIAAAINTNYANYEWEEDSMFIGFQSEIERLGTTYGRKFLKLTVTDDKGCTATSIQSYFVMEEVYLYPINIFTPNDDSLNDYFQIPMKGIAHFNISIFNRWGELLVKLNNENPKWDGRINGKLVPCGSYFYILSATSFNKQLFNFSATLTVTY